MSFSHVDGNIAHVCIVDLCRIVIYLYIPPDPNFRRDIPTETPIEKATGRILGQNKYAITSVSTIEANNPSEGVDRDNTINSGGQEQRGMQSLHDVSLKL